MGRYFQIVRFVSTVLVGIGIFQPLPARSSTAAPRLTAEEIVANLVRRNFERAHALRAYRGSRVYHLEYRGFAGARSAEMTVDVQYRSPGTKEFIIRSEKGSHLLIDRVFQKLLQSEKEALTEDNQARIALNTVNYRFTLAGYQTLTTRECYILSVEPRTKSKFLYRGRIWVDSEDFAVVRIEATPAQNPSFWTKDTRIEQTYAKVEGFWLPSFNRSSSAIRLGGHADFTIDYHDYQITAATTQETVGNVGAYR